MSNQVLRADVCPACRSENVTGGSITVEMSIAYQGVRCEECDTRFTVMFAVMRILIVNPEQVRRG